MNFTTPEDCINSTTSSIRILSDLEICMLFVYLLFALPAHSYVIWLIITGTGSGVASEFFVLNLSVCEIGNCLNMLPFVMSYWIVGLIKLSQFLQGLSFTGRPLFQCVICVERYLAVVHPVIFLKYKPLRYRVICCTAVWIITLGSCVCCVLVIMFSTSDVHPWFSLLQFLLFLFIQLFCLVAVLRALKQSGPGERGGERGGNHMKRRAFHLILITTVTMLITYVPYNIITLLNTLTKQNNHKLWFIVVVCYLLASFVQPVVYLHRAGKLSRLSEILQCTI